MSVIRKQGRHLGPAGPDGKARPRCIYANCDGDAVVHGTCLDHALAIWVALQQAHLDLVEKARGAGPTPKLPPSPDGLVYIIRLGDRIKIGFTTNLRQRMRDLPHEEILAVVPGTMEDERRCHAAFAHLRVAGEWFRADLEIVRFAAEVDTRDRHS